MARVTTKPTNAAVTAKPQRAAGIRLADGSKLVGVLFGSDMTTVLGFVLQNAQGGNSIETVADFSKKVRIGDYVDAYGRCVPKKLREFQARDGHSLPFSRVLKTDTNTGITPDPKTITVEVINQLLSACAFAPMPDYAMVQSVIRRASTTADAEAGSCVDSEGLMGLALLLHYPDMKRKKRVKDPTGQVRSVPITVKEHTIKKFLPAYDAYSLPFEVKKYAVKRTAVKTALGATTPLYNYYVSIKKEGLPLCNSNNPTDIEKATTLLQKEAAAGYSPAFDPELVQAMYLQQDDIDNFRKNGVFIKGAGAAAPVSAIKSDFTTTDLFDFDSEEEVAAPAAVPATAPAATEEVESVGDAPSADVSEDVAIAGGGEVAGMPEASDEGIGNAFDGVTILDAPTVGSDGDLSTPIDRGVTLPSTVMNPGLFDANSAKILAEARSRWDALCTKMRAAADAICDGVDYTYDDKNKSLGAPVAYMGNDKICYEDKGARRAELVFGDTKKGTKYPLLTLNSINVKIYRKFYAAFMDGVENIPVESSLSYDTVTLYAFDGKPKGAAGFGIDLPTGEHFTSSDIHKELKAIAELMHSLGDDAVQTNLTRTFLNAGLAATWRQAIKEKRRELGLNTAAVAKSKSMELRITEMVNAKLGSAEDAKELLTIVLDMAFANNSVDNFNGGTIPYDPVTSEYRGGKGTTYSEWELGKTVARTIDDITAEDANTAGYKASTSKQVQAYIAELRTREGGTPWDVDKRVAAVAEMVAKKEVEDLKETTETTPDFDWGSYEVLKAAALAKTGKEQIGKSQSVKSSSSDYALSFDMHLGAEDIAGMQASGIALSEESPVLVNAAAKLDSNVQAMVLWLLATVGVGDNTNDGLQFVGGDESMAGLWTDKSKAARAGAATHTSTYEYVATTPDGKAVTFGASLKQPV